MTPKLSKDTETPSVRSSPDHEPEPEETPEMTETPPARSETPRGFTIYDQFTDTYGSVVRVQESSAATGPRVWIFSENKQDPGVTSPHLDVTQAERVRDALDTFIREQHEIAESEGRAAAEPYEET